LGAFRGGNPLERIVAISDKWSGKLPRYDDLGSFGLGFRLDREDQAGGAEGGQEGGGVVHWDGGRGRKKKKKEGSRTTAAARARPAEEARGRVGGKVLLCGFTHDVRMAGL
jgi:hypothetical protein